MMEDSLNSAQIFIHAVTALPDAVRERLDADAPLDWAAIEDPATAVDLREAAQAGHRLPDAVETLAARLIGEMGIVPADLVAGFEREGAASAWLPHLSLEPDGDLYRLRNDRTGEVHAGIRAEAVAGHVVLALDLAAAVHETAELWIDASERCEADPERTDPLARFAVRMGDRLQALAGDNPTAGAAVAILAGTLEDTWNAQDAETRAELSAAVPPGAADGICPPRRRYLTPVESYRMHACDPGEIRWMRALAERAGAPVQEPEEADSETATAGPQPADLSEAGETGQDDAHAPQAGTASEVEFVDAPGSGSEDLGIGRELAELRRTADLLSAPSARNLAAEVVAAAGPAAAAASLDMTALEVDIGVDAMNALEFGPDPDGPGLEEELAGLGHAASLLPGAVRRRLGKSYGVGVALALARFQDERQTDEVAAELRKAIAGKRMPSWLEELAAALMADAGAETRDGMRTRSVRLDLTEGPERGYLATETGSGAAGRLGPGGLMRQTRLAMTFARDAWSGLETLRASATEGGWTLEEGRNGHSELRADERETLEAARQILRALHRIRGDANLDPARPPGALKQAAMAAESIRVVGPTARAAAGWPGASQPPDPRKPEDVARIVACARDLHDSIKSISDRLIAGGMAAQSARQEA